jgi:cyclomaltodextrin glucanotransferase
MKKAALLLSVTSRLLAGPGPAQQLSDESLQQRDYRSRKIYFLMADRFHPHQRYSPYVDPQYPSATNSVNCVVQTCAQEEQFRKYWGGDIQGIIQKLDYLEDLGISAIRVTPLMENVRVCVGGTDYGTGYHGYWIRYRTLP